jgi:hypothetical protein
LPTTVYYIWSFSFCLPPLEPRPWHMFYLFIIMLEAFLHSLRKSKFLHTCIQPYDFFHRGLYIFLEVDIFFFCIWGVQRCFFIIFFLKADGIKFSTNPSFIPQNLTHYWSKVISKFPQSESQLGSLGCKGLKCNAIISLPFLIVFFLILPWALLAKKHFHYLESKWQKAFYQGECIL